MGQLYSVFDITYDPTDASNPAGTYTPYLFTNDRQEIDSPFTRREGITALADADDVLDYYARRGGPIDKRDFTVTLRVLTHGRPDAAQDTLFAAIKGGGRPVRLVYLTDGGGFWYTTGHLTGFRPKLTVDRDYYIDFDVTWRIRPDWRPHYSVDSLDIWGSNDGVWGTADGVWGSLGRVDLPLVSNIFTLDNTGTAGIDMPTLDDTAPKITINGPFGSDGGIIITNGTARYTDSDGSDQPYKVIIPFPLVGVGDQVVLTLERRSFVAAGTIPLTAANQRPIRNSAAQPEYFRIVAGKSNVVSVSCYPGGTTNHTGGNIQIDWWKKRG